MSIKKIPLRSLLVNRANDRHGELENETAAIAWLFKEREQHMRNLARDIASQGEIYELPLVSPEADKYIVFDGNRRITCIKLLDDPRRAPSVELQGFFKELRGQCKDDLFQGVQCQVENDRDRIDEILFRRHTGTQNGVGQSTWDDRMKATFVARTGKGNGPSVADEIEKRLSEAQLLPSRRKIPRSTLNRLLSAEPFRSRVGFSMKRGKFEFTHDPAKALAALARIAKDLSNRDIVLGDIWDVDGKQHYLDRLASEGVLPTAGDFLDAKKPEKSKVRVEPEPVRPTVKLSPTVRSTLIPQKEFGLPWPGRLQRHHQIWEELQFFLDPRKHSNAVSVLLRVLLELSVENYIKEQNVAVQDNDMLALRLEKVGIHLHANGQIDSKQLEVLKKFKQGDKLVSADTLNRYVHSPNFAPSPEHLMSMWDSLADVIVCCLRV